MKELNVIYNKEDKKVEKLAASTEKITEEKIEDSLNYDLLTKEEQNAINEFNEKIDVYDNTQILEFGSAAQNKISKFSDDILNDIRTKDTGEVGESLSKLVSELKSFDKSVVDSQNMNIIEKLFSNVKKEVNKLVAKYNKVEKNVDSIETNLEKQRINMLKDIATFDTMYEKNLEFFKEVSLYIIAGEKKLEELRTTVLPELEKKARETNEQLDVQKVNDMNNIINRFEKKIYDLKTTRLISIQMAPQIRLLQSNEAELVEKIQSSITNTIPLWKNQMVLALGINRAKAALESQKAVNELTNDMLNKNSETLKQGTIDIAGESERAIVDIETLRKTNQDIIETLNKVVEIHENGRIKRQESEKELESLEKELKSKLLEINVKK